jgi:ATP-dependent exoDNAse (exonuclease V) beta subunit
LEEDQDQTVAVLVPRNERGAKMVDALREAQIEYVELLRSSLPTRRTANILACALFALSEPADAPRLSDLYQALNEDVNASREIKALVRAEAQILRSCRKVEKNFISPARRRLVGYAAPAGEQREKQFHAWNICVHCCTAGSQPASCRLTS